ncbi:MAG: hypothetical protein ACRECH_10680 [Nitrososphaerales archaeon]
MANEAELGAAFLAGIAATLAALFVIGTVSSGSTSGRDYRIDVAPGTPNPNFS